MAGAYPVPFQQKINRAAEMMLDRIRSSSLARSATIAAAFEFAHPRMRRVLVVAAAEEIKCFRGRMATQTVELCKPELGYG